ncbi:MAG: hypothetical protein QXE93_00865, partial [Candidatus Pacearchaeota archaeon]
MMKLVQELMAKGYLIESDVLKTEFFKEIEKIDENLLVELILESKPPKIITKEFLLSKILFFIERLKNYKNEEILKLASLLLEKYPKEEKQEPAKEFSSGGVAIVKEYNFKTKKLEVEDFVNYFRERYKFFKSILQERNLEGLTSIGKIFGNRKNITIIGLVYEKRYTKNKNIILELEDLTGRISVIVNKEKKELFEKASSVVLDEVIAVTGSSSGELFFANDIIFPDIAINKLKYSPKDEYAVFIADLHVGSDKFLEENFLKFISWING